MRTTSTSAPPKTHTPAPWEIAEGGCALYTRGHRLIAQFTPSAQGSVDAKLCSVAPEMKHALDRTEGFLITRERYLSKALVLTPDDEPTAVELGFIQELLSRVRDVLQRSEWP